ncbi:PAS domain S-box protein [Dokdonia ponticola]|uniref:histidine kinase n=1 Tax=Dokdonia ponticola TaxID=2041041 RepID=A0ABV9HTS0_9FLAO
MSQEQIDILQRTLQREKAARKIAEKILEEKSLQLYNTAQELKVANQQLEQLLDEKTSQLQGIFENINDAYVVMNLEGNILKMNDAAIDLFGYDIEKETLNVVSLIYKEDFAYAMQSFHELKTNHFFTNYTARITTKSKEVRWVHINASIVFDKNKTPIAAQGIVRDITEEKAAEQRLIDSENRLSTLILNLESAVLLENEHRNIVITNKRFCDFFSIPATPEQLVGQNCEHAAEQSKHLFEDPEGFVARILTLTRNKKQVLADELTLTDGRILERDFIPIYEDGHYKGHLWTYRDVTLRRRFRENIEAERVKYSNIIANMKLGLIEVNNDDEILMVNQSLEEMSGYTEAELLGKKGAEILLEKGFKEKMQDENQKRIKGQSNSYEVLARTKNGDLRYWLISGAPNYNLNGKVVGSIGIHLDITELKQLELQKENLLQKLEKSNDELQEYAHIVSHDLKSPLRSIEALTSWIKADNKEKLDEASLKNFDLIEMTLEKMEQLISDILKYSSIGSNTEDTQEVDLNTVVQDVKQVLYIPDNISVTSLKNLPVVKGDKIKFQQVFQNLIGNAIKFNDKEKGTITIDYVDKKSYHQFSISDNGMGIEKKYHEAIFKIFNSLKQSKDSSGIGLSIVKKVIDLYKGNIWVASELNKGTTFYFTLKK